MSNLNLNKKTYIYELPYAERKEFCNIIDMNDKWEELGGNYMKIDCATLFKISKAPMRNHSSTDELLTLWGEQNHTILELFTILYEMQHYRAMVILKPFVDHKYHKLIYQGDKSFSNLVKTETGNNLNNEVGNLIKLNSDSNQRRINNLEREDLNTLGKINEQIYSDPSVMFSSAEACTPLITYNELEQATNYWNKENILGKGGFGVVFKGIWKNTAVAIKRLESQKGAEQQFNILEAQRQQSLRELKYLNSCRHDNILSLYGFSIGGEKPCLVYQYMINGSLEDRLQCRQGTKPLTWCIRFKIATGSARGLQFLHGMDKPLIHGDIKSANILLDPYFEPRIGDFGLAREGPLQEYTHVKVSHVHGTRPYLPDEFLRGKKFSTKVDTYSFGVSPVPSNQLFKQNTSPVPHYGALIVPDQIEGAAMPQIEKNNCLKVTSHPVSARSTNASPSINESLSNSQLTNNSNEDLTSSTPKFVDSKLQTSVENKNSAWNNSIPGECDDLPLISELRLQPNQNSV
ncbi:serine/threonine-protein kinase pelle-like isoform X2 [Myzus persicae]|uniref:serine/threonine-protein kinase pelle-like isoform X2 n=1 Tax=Myzus persicae TaxID=13164 RepID=UPI000B934D76|nr:serine/threonine-protein kinase pelle-like isoform X2 [Myzus persicae]